MGYRKKDEDKDPLTFDNLILTTLSYIAHLFVHYVDIWHITEMMIWQLNNYMFNTCFSSNIWFNQT